MTSPRTVEALASMAKIEHIIRKFRELIDTDSSIPPNLRGKLHTTLDKHLLAAKKQIVDDSGIH